MVKELDKYPWISFKLDLARIPYDIWFLLGECVSKCEHIKHVPLLPDARKRLHSLYLAKGVHATTAIEGNTLSQEQVESIIESKKSDADIKSYQEQEVFNIVNACNDIANGLREGRYQLIDNSLLTEFNSKVLKDVPVDDDIEPGRIRKIAVGVGRYQAPESKDVGELLDRFYEFINHLPLKCAGLEPGALGIIKAIAAHLYIAWIHPFGDGNGRTARLIEFMILLGCGIPSPAAHLLSNHYNQTRMQYYRELDYTSKSKGDISRFFSYSIKGLHDELKKVIDNIISQVQSISWEHYVYEEFRKMRSSDMLKRQRSVLLEISKQWRPLSKGEVRKLTAEIYLKEKKKVNSFTRDLNDLVEMGYLVEKDDEYRPKLELILERLPFSV